MIFTQFKRSTCCIWRSGVDESTHLGPRGWHPDCGGRCRSALRSGRRPSRCAPGAGWRRRCCCWSPRLRALTRPTCARKKPLLKSIRNIVIPLFCLNNQKTNFCIFVLLYFPSCDVSCSSCDHNFLKEHNNGCIKHICAGGTHYQSRGKSASVLTLRKSAALNETTSCCQRVRCQRTSGGSDAWTIWNLLFIAASPIGGAAGRLTAPVSELSEAIYRATPPRCAS